MWNTQNRLPQAGTIGRNYKVTGHWSKDFIGELVYRGNDLAILKDEQGQEREVCYLQNVEFELLP